MAPQNDILPGRKDALVLQIPSQKVFRPQKTTPKTVSEGVWSCRDVNILQYFHVEANYFTSYDPHRDMSRPIFGHRSFIF